MGMWGTNQFVLGNSDFVDRSGCFLFVQKPGELTLQTECAEDGEPCSPTTKPPFCTLLISSKPALHPHSPSHPSGSLCFFSWLKLCASSAHFPQTAGAPSRGCCRSCSQEIPPLTGVRTLLSHPTSCLELG